MATPEPLDAVDLTGLPVASPIGFMAALGLLRVLAQDHGWPVRLSWPGACARLHGIGRGAVVEALLAHMAGRSRAPEFNFPVAGEGGRETPVTHLRTLTPADYRAAAAAFAGDTRALAFLAGYGTDAVVDDDGCIARTRLDFTSGQQKLMHELRALAAVLDPQARRPAVPLVTRVERALFGGPYEQQSSFGWDASALRVHAHEPEPPAETPPPGQPMTVWLAAEALPLHPVLPAEPRRANTAGFLQGRAYVWPQWRAPLSLAEVALLRQRPVASLDALPGVAGVWASTVTSVGKYGFLLPAARTPSVAALRERFARR
ncbi:MAG: hypothetical protein O9343_11080 [Burkholderiaceae bacterium]|jgi:hypothetical protein|nr:hypothetical protein [Burkholderiaceae bacterium]MCZ8175725.1 hypothetical protein [Burkholderiaceae bacterium]